MRRLCTTVGMAAREVPGRRLGCWRTAFLFCLGVLATACGGTVGGGGGGGGGGGASDTTAALVNGPDRETSTSSWHVIDGPNWWVAAPRFAFYADGTMEIDCSTQSGPVTTTWQASGDDSIVLSNSACFQTLTDIAGSVAAGSFSALLSKQDSPTPGPNWVTFGLREPFRDAGSGEGEVLVTSMADTSVRAYRYAATGDATPLRILRGGNTQLSQPVDLVVDAHYDELVVANFGSAAITAYPRLADGNVSPLRVLSGPTTRIVVPGPSSRAFRIALDTTNDELFVVSPTSRAVFAFPGDAQGDAAPIRTLEGPNTTFVEPCDVEVDPASGELLVTDAGTLHGTGPNGHRLLVFARNAQGDVAPLRILQIAGASGSTGLPTIHVGLDVPNGEVFVQNRAGTIYAYGRTASGATPPLRSRGLGQWPFVIDVAAGEVVASMGTSVIFAPSTLDTNDYQRNLLTGSITSVAIGP